jgi:hypothetical protein
LSGSDKPAVMKYIIVITYLFSCFQTYAQDKPARPDRPYLVRLMDDVGYNYNVINDSLCQVVFKGDTLKLYDVNVLHFEDMVIVYVNLTRQGELQKIPVDLNHRNMQKVLHFNIHFDYLKFGVEKSNGDFFVRTDILTLGLNSKTLRRFIDQVGRAANEIYPEMTSKN